MPTTLRYGSEECHIVAWDEMSACALDSAGFFEFTDEWFALTFARKVAADPLTRGPLRRLLGDSTGRSPRSDHEIIDAFASALMRGRLKVIRHADEVAEGPSWGEAIMDSLRGLLRAPGRPTRTDIPAGDPEPAPEPEPIPASRVATPPPTGPTEEEEQEEDVVLISLAAPDGATVKFARDETDIDWDFIAAREGAGRTSGYVPTDRSGNAIGNSGVTIATGFDIGQHNEADLNGLGLDSALVDKLKPYCGATRADAIQLLQTSPVTITTNQVEAIDAAVHADRTDRLARDYDGACSATDVKFFCLTRAQQTAVASVALQYGSLSRKTPNFWGQVTAGDWGACLANLRNFGDAYGPRRNLEGDLIEGDANAAEGVGEMQLEAEINRSASGKTVCFSLQGDGGSSVETKDGSVGSDKKARVTLKLHRGDQENETGLIATNTGDAAKINVQAWLKDKPDDKQSLEVTVTGVFRVRPTFGAAPASRSTPAPTEDHVCQEGTLPKVGVAFCFNPILFKKNENPASSSAFAAVTEDQFNTFELLADGESAAEIKVELIKLNGSGAIDGNEIEHATASEHQDEGKVIVELDSETCGTLKCGDQSGARIEVAISEAANASIKFVTTQEIGTTKLKISIEDNKCDKGTVNCKYQYVSSFAIPSGSRIKRELTVGSREVGTGTKGYDALKFQWYLRQFGFISYRQQTCSARGSSCEWTNTGDIALDGDFGGRSGRCLRDFLRVSKGSFRNKDNTGVAITYTAAVTNKVNKDVIAEILAWKEGSYKVEPYHGIAHLEHSATGQTAIDADVKIVYNTIVQGNEWKGYIHRANQIGESTVHWGSQSFVVGEAIHTAIRLFKWNGSADEIALRLHDADPSDLLDSANLNSTLKTRILDLIRTIRKQQGGATSGSTSRNVRVFSTYRSVAEQNIIYAKGRTTNGVPCKHNGVPRAVGTCTTHPLGATVSNAQGGTSWHNFGAAVDLVFCNTTGSPSWSENRNWANNGTVSATCNLTWGGNWTKPDRPHHQLSSAGSPSTAIKNMYNTTQGTELQKLQAVWALL